MIEKDKVEVKDEEGVLKKYEDYATASGKCVTRCFCGVCGKYVISRYHYLFGNLVACFSGWLRVG